MAIDPALSSLINQFSAMGQSTSPDMNKMMDLENQILAKEQGAMQAAAQQNAIQTPVIQPPTQYYTDAQGTQQSFQPLPADPNATFQTDMQSELSNPIYKPYTSMGTAAASGLPMPATPSMLGTPQMAQMLSSAQAQLGQGGQLPTLQGSGLGAQMQSMIASSQAQFASQVQQAGAGSTGSANFTFNYTPITSSWVYKPSAEAQAQITNLTMTAPRGEGRGTGAFAARLAQERVGQAACNVHMAEYSHAGGVTNDCADFVSSCIADAGRFKKSADDISVTHFRTNLINQGYQPVPKGHAQPGDVAIILGNGIEHTELVVAPGATQCVGANGTTWEQISKDNLQWAGATVTYYHKP
jgi:hypothetical protein